MELCSMLPGSLNGGAGVWRMDTCVPVAESLHHSLETVVTLFVDCLLLCSLVRSQWYPTLWSPMDYSLPGSSVHEIFPARLLEWVAISCSRESSQPRDRTQVSCISCIAGEFFTAEPLGLLILTELKIKQNNILKLNSILFISRCELLQWKKYAIIITIFLFTL